MIYGVILAGGIGSRMGSVEKPKQFLSIGDKPVIVHTVEKFCLMKEFDEVVTELLFLATDGDSLKTRIEQLAKGGEAQ